MTTAAPMVADAAFIEACAKTLESTDDYRVLRRFVPRARYTDESWNLGAPDRAKCALYVDVEATGLDRENDQIIELSVVPFTYDPERAVVFEVQRGSSWLEEPAVPISPEIEELTGISGAMVKGHRIDDNAVEKLVERAAIVIAHNAEYDRQMLERRLPIFEYAAWACSQREVPWREFGVAGGALANILISACREFTDDAHRALNDCQVGVHVLAASALDGRTGLSYLLESARQPTSRVCALNSPMGAKDLLRARGYRALYLYGRFAYWYKDLREKVAEELTWCRDIADAEPQIKILTARDRYSLRSQE